MILRIQGRRHPALPNERRRISGESNPRTGGIKPLCIFLKQHEDYLPSSDDKQSRFQVQPQADPASAAVSWLLSRDATRFKIW